MVEVDRCRLDLAIYHLVEVDRGRLDLALFTLLARLEVESDKPGQGGDVELAWVQLTIHLPRRKPLDLLLLAEIPVAVCPWTNKIP